MIFGFFTLLLELVIKSKVVGNRKNLRLLNYGTRLLFTFAVWFKVEWWKCRRRSKACECLSEWYLMSFAYKLARRQSQKSLCNTYIIKRFTSSQNDRHYQYEWRHSRVNLLEHEKAEWTQPISSKIVIIYFNIPCIKWP